MTGHVIKTLEIPIRDSGAEIRVLQEAGKSLAYVDPVYVEGVIVNLIDNSLKYAGPRPEKEVLIRSDRSGSTLSVRDNGPGIPREYRTQVFDKFFRIPQGDRHDVKGYGLGLNFASQVMSKHDGSISLEENPRGGIIFILHFPNKKI
jgi:two-component system phosphate regulon sensor histidine kinase PhoR